MLLTIPSSVRLNSYWAPGFPRGMLVRQLSLDMVFYDGRSRFLFIAADTEGFEASACVGIIVTMPPAT